MKINIHAVPDAGLDLADDILPQDLELDPDEFELRGAGYLEVHVRKLGQNFLVNARVRVRVVRPCARCLEPAVEAVDAEFETLYQPGDAALRRDDQTVEADDVGVIIFQGHELDLTPEIRQALLLALPFKALCRPDCKGLCPRCGANLNEGPCACARPDAAAAERASWEALAKKWAKTHIG